jgi:hypothetical protein
MFGRELVVLSGAVARAPDDDSVRSCESLSPFSEV